MKKGLNGMKKIHLLIKKMADIKKYQEFVARFLKLKETLCEKNKVILYKYSDDADHCKLVNEKDVNLSCYTNENRVCFTLKNVDYDKENEKVEGCRKCGKSMPSMAMEGEIIYTATMRISYTAYMSRYHFYYCECDAKHGDGPNEGDPTQIGRAPEDIFFKLRTFNDKFYPYQFDFIVSLDDLDRLIQA